MRRFAWAVTMVGVFVAAALAGGFASHTPTARGFDPTKLTDEQEKILSGFADMELFPDRNDTSGSRPTTYTPRGSGDCTFVNSSNVKVNQNCLNLSDPDLAGRGQAQNETSIAQDPNNPNHVIASYNDYRRGDGNCGASWSTDKGHTWNDSTVPTSFTRGRVQNVVDFGSTREYWGGGGDTSVAWDTKGNGYLSCQLFNRGRPTSSAADTSSALVVYRATKNEGASWNFPGRYVRASNDTTGTGVSPFLDKQLMTVDNNPTACAASQTTAQRGASCTPFQDRIYVTWTEFAADGSAYIYEAYSADYGEHFSEPHLVSANTPLCTNTYGAGTPFGNCNENQDSQPFTGPDGVLYVVWNNYNNEETKAGPDNRNQVLLAKSVDGGNTFTPPIRVTDYYDLPDCATYQKGQDAGRLCVPEKNATNNSVFRASNYPVGAVDPTNPLKVIVTQGSYINRHSNESNGCVPTGVNPATGGNLYTGVKVPGACNNDILLSVSGDGGNTFTGTATDPRAEQTVNQDPDQALSDQWWQWATFNKLGKLAVSYYDRQYGARTTVTGSSSSQTVPADEATGFSDVSLSASGDLTTFNTYRATSSANPPPTQFGGLFWGDYTGLSAVDSALPLWSDTRNPELFPCADTTTGQITTPPSVCTGNAENADVANDQDVYTANQPVSAR